MNHTYANHIQYKTDFDLSIQFPNGIFNFRSLYIFPAGVFLLAADFDFIQLNSFPFMTNILLYVMKKKIYLRDCPSLKGFHPLFL